MFGWLGWVSPPLSPPWRRLLAQDAPGRPRGTAWLSPPRRPALINISGAIEMRPQHEQHERRAGIVLRILPLEGLRRLTDLLVGAVSCPCRVSMPWECVHGIHGGHDPPFDLLPIVEHCQQLYVSFGSTGETPVPSWLCAGTVQVSRQGSLHCMGHPLDVNPRTGAWLAPAKRLLACVAFAQQLAHRHKHMRRWALPRARSGCSLGAGETLRRVCEAPPDGVCGCLQCLAPHLV